MPNAFFWAPVCLPESQPRSDLLAKQGLVFDTADSGFEENLSKADYPHPKDYVLATSCGKMEALCALLGDSLKSWDVIITCDTIVVDCKGHILEKPVSLLGVESRAL
jgi:predicted house-cleaning NTP pyrophosphatase (Maf/HAM1 superfamily)